MTISTRPAAMSSSSWRSRSTVSTTSLERTRMRLPGNRAARRSVAAQIDRLDDRQVLAAEALGQMQAAVAAALRVDLGLNRRRGGGEQQRDLRLARAHHRHVAGVIADALFLLVDGIVL